MQEPIAQVATQMGCECWQLGSAAPVALGCQCRQPALKTHAT